MANVTMTNPKTVKEMDKWGIGMAIGFVLIAHGKKTYESIVLKGSDKALVAEFGDMFKGRTVVVDGLNNAIRSYKTSQRGERLTSRSIINGVVDISHRNGGERLSDLLVMRDQRNVAYDLMEAYFENKRMA